MGERGTIAYREAAELPALAWGLTHNRGSVEVVHGQRLERSDTWFTDGAWAGDFAAGALDEHFLCGTGARIVAGRLHAFGVPHAVPRRVMARLASRFSVYPDCTYLLPHWGAEVVADRYRDTLSQTVPRSVTRNIVT